MYEKLIGTKMNDFALVLHRLLPAKSTQPYNLRPRRHSFSLTQKQSSYDDCNFSATCYFMISIESTVCYT